MTSETKNIGHAILYKLPLVGIWIRERVIRRRFRVERELIEGRHKATSSHQSIIHFSVNRSATQFVGGILNRCTAEEGMAHANFHGYAFHTDFPFLDHLSAKEMRQFHHIFRSAGYLYGPFGGLIEGIPNLQDYLVVLMIRDPRDVLTSRYFSKAYSHKLPGLHKMELFKEHRRLARSAGIDQFVIELSETERQIYQEYLDHLVNRPNVYVTTYEHMVNDFTAWLDGLLNFCQLKIGPSLRGSILAEADEARNTKEDIYKHRRQVTPGDHKRKLRLETIAVLNSTFSDILKGFGYI